MLERFDNNELPRSKPLPSFLIKNPDNRVHVFSIEDHECLLNKQYRDLKNGRTESLAATLGNLSLCEYIQSQAEESILLSGSIYQSHKAQVLRENNNPNTGNFISALSGFCARTQFDNFMLSDIFSIPMQNENLQRNLKLLEEEKNLKEEAANASEEKKKFLRRQIPALQKANDAKRKTLLDIPMDQSRLLLLYAQMHHIAAQDPNKEIKFTFVHPSEDLLNTVFDFFSHPDFIQLKPKNIALHLVQYKGDEAPKEISFVGIGRGGEIDKNYKENTKKIYQAYKEKFDINIDARHHLISKIKEDAILGKRFVANFIKNRKIIPLEQELCEYRKKRVVRSDYYTFWGRIKGMSKQVKLNAVDKVLDCLKGKTVDFDEKDLSALNDGSLGAIISKHSDREEIKSIYSQLEAMRKEKQKEICTNFVFGRL